jgi:hypothetical protein
MAFSTSETRIHHFSFLTAEMTAKIINLRRKIVVRIKILPPVDINNLIPFVKHQVIAKHIHKVSAASFTYKRS